MKKQAFLLVFLMLLSGLAFGGEKDAARAYLDVVIKEMNTSISGWQVWKGQGWEDYAPGRGLSMENIRLKAPLNLKKIYSGVDVEKSPVHIELRMVGRGLING